MNALSTSITRKFVVVVILLSVFLAVDRAAPILALEPPAQDSAESVFSPRLEGFLVENRGQYPEAVLFVARHGNSLTWITRDRIWITSLAAVDEEQLRVANASVRFVGANRQPEIETVDRVQTRLSYLTGSDPAQWRTDVPAWGGIRIRDLYPGIDLVLDARGGDGLHWQLDSRPDADPSAVLLQVDGASAAEAVDAGTILHGAGGDSLLLPLQGLRPVNTEELNADRWPRNVLLPDSGLLFLTYAGAGPASPNHPETPDGPEDLLYSTYLGGSDWDRGYGTAIDPTGDFYIAGRTPSPDFPTTPGAYTTTLQVLDAFVAKLSPGGAGSADMIYGTFIGGADFDSAYGLDVVSGQVYLTGDTRSPDFPITNGAYDTTCGTDGICDGWSDAFLLKLSADGSSVLYSTYFGGKDEETASAIDVSGGAAYLTGLTKSEDMPTTNGAYDRTCGTDGRCNRSGNIPTQDGFVVKILPQGNGGIDLAYSSFFGGSGRDQGNGVVLSSGDIFLTGRTASTDFPPSGTGGGNDAFALRIDPAGAGAADLVYGLRLGGTADDTGYGIAALGDVAYITGETRSTDFPVTTGTFQGGLSDSFFVQLSGSGNVTYGVFLGGTAADVGQNITLDDSGSPVLTGYTSSSDFPVTDDPYDSTYNGGRDIYVTRISFTSSNPDFITYSSYVGGTGDDEAADLAIDELGATILTGNTTSADFPVTAGAFDTGLYGSRDSFGVLLQVFQPPAVRIEKSTNLLDSDEPPGAYLEVGTTINWDYVVSNNGDSTLSSILVLDNQGVTVSCPATSLNPGESMTCTASSTASPGQYANLGSVTANPPGGLDPVVDNDPSHYFGAIPQIDIEKFVNGIDADTAPGVYLVAGEVMTWTYSITNTGNVPLVGITTLDDQIGPVSCPYSQLEANQSMTCVVTDTVTTGPYTNLGSVNATPPGGLADVGDSDPANYFGAFLELALDKRIEGIDAPSAPGPEILAGETVNWTYTITNTSNVTLTGVTLNDDQLGPITCPQTTLPPGTGMVCTASAAVTPGAYANLGSVTGIPPTGLSDLSAQDTSHHFGALPAISIEKITSGLDADGPPYPSVLVGSPITWTYAVTNSGNVPLSGLSVIDSDPGAIPAFQGGDTNGNGMLDVGELWTYTATGVALTGTYTNTSTVSGAYTDDLGNAAAPSAQDPSGYFGADADLVLDVTTNGQDGSDILAGTPVTWTYSVANTGNVPLANVVVTDTQALGPAYLSGDTNGNSLLDVTEIWMYQAIGTSAPGLFVNTGWARAAYTDTFGTTAVPQSADGSSYFGASPSLSIDKVINDTDGSTILVGAPITWTFTVTNTGNIVLSPVVINDSTLGQVPCPATTLGAGAMMTCEVTGAAAAGQHTNTATINLTYTDDHGSSLAIQESDASAYFGADPVLSIQKFTNGVRATTPPGPFIPTGNPITWTFDVTNTGNIALDQIALNDDMLGAVPCPQTSLNPQEGMTCTFNGLAEAGQHSNLATVSMTFTDDHGRSLLVSADDAGHYFGASPNIDLEKFTNGVDADSPTGPYILVGDPVTWTFTITNTGNVTLTDILVVDDAGTVSTADDIQVCSFTSLGVAENQTCTLPGQAVEGQYANTAVVTSTYELVGTRVDFDTSHYYGAAPALTIETTTNGEDADSAPGPFIPLDGSVQWTYTFTNTGNVPLAGLMVTDDAGTPGNPADDFTVCTVSSLAVLASASCQSPQVSPLLGQYANTGTVTGTPPGGLPDFSASDPSHYFGYDPNESVDLDMQIAGQNAAVPPGPTLEAFAPFTTTYTVFNVSPTDLISITVTDDNGTPGQPGDDFTACQIGLLLPFTWQTCAHVRAAGAGQQALSAEVTAFLSDSQTQVTANDAAYYFGADLQLQIEKTTNGVDADSPPGPILLAGEPVTWTYILTSTSNITLVNVLVEDSDLGVIPVCPGDVLLPGEVMTCSAPGTAAAGPYSNTGTVSAQTPAGGLFIESQDLSHYYGAVPDIALGIRVNGEDVSAVPGVYLSAGEGFDWTYVITNTGNITLTGLVVQDSLPSVILCPGTSLAPGETIACQAADTAAVGQNQNAVSVQAAFAQTFVSDTAEGFVFGAVVGILLDKNINGSPADNPPGPTLLAGEAISWTFHVTSTSNVTLTDVLITDPGLQVSCPQNILTPIQPAMTCTAAGSVLPGAQQNTAQVTGTPPGGLADVSDLNAAHYFGADPQIDIEKLTNMEDADIPPGPSVNPNAIVTWTYIVTNTGNVDLTNVVVQDDILGLIPCPGAGLDAGESMTCEISGPSEAGQYANLGTVTAMYEVLTVGVQDQDWSHYFGISFFLSHLPVIYR